MTDLLYSSLAADELTKKTIKNLVPYFQCNPSEYDMFKCMVEGKMYYDVICETDIENILKVDRQKDYVRAVSQYESNEQLKQDALDGYCFALHVLGFRYVHLCSPRTDYIQYKLGLMLLMLAYGYDKANNVLKLYFKNVDLEEIAKLKTFADMSKFVDEHAWKGN